MAGQTYVMQRLRSSSIGQILSRKNLEEIAVVSKSPQPKWCPACGAEVPAWAGSCPACGLSRAAMDGLPADDEDAHDEPPAVKNELYDQLVESGRLVVERIETTRAGSPTSFEATGMR